MVCLEATKSLHRFKMAYLEATRSLHCFKMANNPFCSDEVIVLLLDKPCEAMKRSCRFQISHFEAMKRFFCFQNKTYLNPWSDCVASNQPFLQ
jgi:hypothetical protein